MNLDPVWAFSEEEECEEERVRKSTRCHSLQDTEPETVFVVFQISVLNERFLLAECQPVVNRLSTTFTTAVVNVVAVATWQLLRVPM